MENLLTSGTRYFQSVSPRFSSPTAPCSPSTEGFGLVRRPPAPRPGRDDDDLQSPMSQAQAAALHALVHPRSSTPGSRWARRDRALDAVWAGTMAALLALAVVSLDSGTAFVAAENHLHAIVAARTSAITAVARQVSMAHQQVAHEQVTRPSATRQSATRQSMTRQSMGQS